MSLDSILGQILQGNVGGAPTQRRLDSATQNLGRSGGGIDSIFGQIQDALGQAGIGGGTRSAAGGSGALGGFAERAKDFLRADQVGGLSGAQVGGIGAAAGAVLGGGVGGAMRGGAMAVLGTLALSALKRARAGGSDIEQDANGQVSLDPSEVRSLASPDTEKLMVRAMLSAAKADGTVDQEEMTKIVGKLSADDLSEDEKQFVMAELKTPVDVNGLAAQASSPAQAAEVYAASLLVINGDNEDERKYLRNLAAAQNLEAGTVAQLHDMTGAPA
jgi:uncharacterized membrane protein YebE (DUF533 family)